MKSVLSRPIRFLQFPQPQSVIDRPIFTVPAHIREIIERNVSDPQFAKYGNCKVIVTDLDTRFTPRLCHKAMWCGNSGSGELHFRSLSTDELPFFIRGHQYLIEVLSVEDRAPDFLKW